MGLGAGVRFWLGADIQRESAELPLLTLSGHSVEHAVQQVGAENQCFPYPVGAPRFPWPCPYGSVPVGFPFTS